jgi:hypothetical protein
VTAPIFDHGQWRNDATVDEIVAEVTTNPTWDFEHSPISFIGWCSTEAVYSYSPPSRRAFWAAVGLRLCDIAGIESGAVLGSFR